MSDPIKDLNTAPDARRPRLTEVGRDFIAAGMLDDASELIALAACSIHESVAQYIEALSTASLGREIQASPPNEFAEVLADMLRGREVISGKPSDPAVSDLPDEGLPPRVRNLLDQELQRMAEAAEDAGMVPEEEQALEAGLSLLDDAMREEPEAS
jgi:hypothetical protein